MIGILFQAHNFYEGSRKNIEIFFGKFLGKGIIGKDGGAPCGMAKNFWKILSTC